MATLRSAYPLPKPWDKSVWGKGNSDHQPICATELRRGQNQFAIIGNSNAATYKEIFPLIKDNLVWKGATANNTDMVFGVPKGAAIRETDSEKAARLGYPSDNDFDYTRMGNSCWFTNIEHGPRIAVQPLARPHRFRHHGTMITRTHTKGDAPSTAVYSPCERYRYSLTRVWDMAGTAVHFVMLNPSTATEIQNDPTVERCERRARALGHGAFRVTNIFAWRDTDPRKMRAAVDPVGPANDAAILDGVTWASQTICAWGTHGAHLGRGAHIEAALRATGAPLFHLGLTKAGHPKHPLYIAYTKQPGLWTAL